MHLQWDTQLTSAKNQLNHSQMPTAPPAHCLCLRKHKAIALQTRTQLVLCRLLLRCAVLRHCLARVQAPALSGHQPEQGIHQGLIWCQPDGPTA